MLMLRSAFYDDMIPNWRMAPVAVAYNILVLVVHGRLIYSINRAKIVAEQGDLVFIPKGTFRGAENDGPHPHRKYSALFSHSFPPGTVPLFDAGRFAIKRIRGFDDAAKRFEALHREMREERPMHEFIAAGILQELVGIASREAETTDMSPTKWRLADILQRHIREHYRRPLQIGELAVLIRRSPNYTISLFKEATGQTPVHYMQQLRIAEARNLLLSTDFTIAEIADYLGFYDTSYFYRTFKKVTGLSPSAFAARRAASSPDAGSADVP
ncbi:helix-turn-helix domain-containing protein [Paenibacillus sp. GYB003]|uniref:helix-turn-helix domain-containing protein n=1 Tax=Paenibacillus sp. GYB003 TaxID=2994392 RepID=UPI002F960AEF